jgi:hypothetical protein
MAIKANLVIDQGTDYSTSINLTDDDGNLVDLTGYSASSQIRKTPSSSNAVSFSVSVAEAQGLVLLSLTDQQTSNLVPGRYVYDVLLTNNNNNLTSRILEGIVTVTPGVTR